MEELDHTKRLGGAISAWNPKLANALCIDGPLEGSRWSLHRMSPISWLGPRPGHPYRPVEDEDGTWVYVYADSVDDDLPFTAGP